MLKSWTPPGHLSHAPLSLTLATTMMMKGRCVLKTTQCCNCWPVLQRYAQCHALSSHQILHINNRAAYVLLHKLWSMHLGIFVSYETKEDAISCDIRCLPSLSWPCEQELAKAEFLYRQEEQRKVFLWDDLWTKVLFPPTRFRGWKLLHFVDFCSKHRRCWVFWYLVDWIMKLILNSCAHAKKNKRTHRFVTFKSTKRHITILPSANNVGCPTKAEENVKFDFKGEKIRKRAQLKYFAPTPLFKLLK